MININLNNMCILQSILANRPNYRGLLVKCDGLGALFFTLTVSYHRFEEFEGSQRITQWNR